MGDVMDPPGGGDLVCPCTLHWPYCSSPPPAVLSKPDLSQKTDILTFKDRKFLILTF